MEGGRGDDCARVGRFKPAVWLSLRVMCSAPADEFGVEGATAFGRMLRANSTVSKLDINGKFPRFFVVNAIDWLCLVHGCLPMRLTSCDARCLQV